jgi:hypothetical protein
MDLVIGRGEWRRKRGAPVPWRQENCLLDEVKTDPKGWNILSPAAGFLCLDRHWTD